MGMLGIVTAIEVQAQVADDHDVITWFGLHTTAPAPTANWSQVENGQITRTRIDQVADETDWRPSVVDGAAAASPDGDDVAGDGDTAR